MSWSPQGFSRLQFIAEEFWPGGGENGDGRDLYGVAEHHGVWREETTDADLIAEALHPSDADYYDREGVAEMDDEEFEAWLAEDDAGEDDRITVNGEPLDTLLGDHGDDPFGEFDEGPAASDHHLDRGNGLVRDYELDGEDGPDTLDLMAAREAVAFLVDLDPGRGYARSRHHREFYNGIDAYADYLAWSHLMSGPSYFTEDSSSELDGVTPGAPGVATALECFTQDGVRKVSLSAERAREFRHKDDRRSRHPKIGRPSPHDLLTNTERARRWNGRQRFDSWKRHREAQHRPRQIDREILDCAERRRTADGSLRYLDPTVLYLRAA